MLFWFAKLADNSVSGQAPLLEAVEYEDVNFENSFAHKTKYRGPPTAELEEEWGKLWHC